MEFIKKLFSIFIILFSVSKFCLFAQEEDSFQETAAEENSIYTKDEQEDAGEKNGSDEKNDSNEEKKSDEKEIIPEYESIIDASNRLHLFSYKDENLEYLTINNRSSDRKTVTVYSNNKIIRYFYDSDFYLAKVEKWKTGKSSADAVLETVSFYEYLNKKNSEENEKKNIYSKKLMTYDLIKKQLTESYFNDSALIFEKYIYDFVETGDNALIYKEKYKNKNRLSYSYVYKYDSQDRIVLDSVFHYEYKNEVTKKVLKKSLRKNIYEYVRVDCPPVKSFYENDVLRMKTVYTSKDDYVILVYFDNNTYVKAEYKNSRKYSEIFYVNQEEKARKIYE